MKRLTILLAVILLVCTAAYASDISLGVMQNYINTSLVSDFETDGFGVEGALGFPLVLAAYELVDYYIEGNTTEMPPNPTLALAIPSVMVNGYWKAIDGRVFDLRLGLQADSMITLEPDGVTALGCWGFSLGLDFRFNNGLSLNLTGAMPASFILSSFDNIIDVDRYTVFFWTSKTDAQTDALLILPVLVNHFARLSLKWSL